MSTDIKNFLDRFYSDPPIFFRGRLQELKGCPVEVWTRFVHRHVSAVSSVERIPMTDKVLFLYSICGARDAPSCGYESQLLSH